ncbi:MAG: hypothetical protein V3V24_09670 [Nitrospinaceae bacterium]
MSVMVSLPPGVTIHVGGQRYRGAIPASVCPKKYQDSDKAAAKPAKSEPKLEGGHD